MKKTLKLLAVLTMLVLLLTIVTGCKKDDTEKNIVNENSANETEQGNKAEEKKLSRGKWENNVYTNEYANLKFTLPEGWTYSSDEEIENLTGVGASMLNEDQQEAFAEAKVDSLYDMIATDTASSSNIMVLFEKTDVSVTAALYLKSVKEGLEAVQAMNYEFNEPTSKATVAGVEYDTLTSTVPEYGITQKYYVLRKGDYFLSIIVTNVNNALDMETVMNSFEQI